MKRTLVYVLASLLTLSLAFRTSGVELSSELTEEEEAELALDESVKKAESKRLETLLDNIRLALLDEDSAGAGEFFRRILVSHREQDDITTPRIKRYGYVIAFSFIRAEKYKDGLEFADDFLELIGDDSRIFHIKGLAYAALGESDKAAESTEKALANNATDEEYRSQVGLYFFDNDSIEVAATEFKKVLELTPDDSETDANANLHLGRIAFREKKLEEAAKSFEKVAAYLANQDLLQENTVVGSEMIQAHMTAARQFELKKQYDKELELLQVAEKYYPHYPYLLNALGSTLTRLEKHEDAANKFKSCIKFYPKFPDAYVGYGDLLLKQDRKDDAEKQFDNAIKLYKETIEKEADAPVPNVGTALNNLAWFYVTHDREIDEGIELSKKSLEHRPDEPAYLDTLAELYYKNGDKEKAIQTIKKAIDKDPPHLIYFKQQLEKFQGKTEGEPDNPK